MVRGSISGLRSIEYQGELLSDLGLADEVLQSLRTQGGFRIAFGGLCST